MHSVLATVTATNGSDTWTSYMSIECWAPELAVGNLVVDDSQGGNGNNRLDAGETADVKIYTSNTGLTMASDAFGSLSLTSGFLTLNNATYTVGNINPLGSGVAIFNVTVNPVAPAGLPVDLIYTIESGEYSATKTFNTQIGLIVEDWETGDFTKFPWTSGGSLPGLSPIWAHMKETIQQNPVPSEIHQVPSSLFSIMFPPMIASGLPIRFQVKPATPEILH